MSENWRSSTWGEEISLEYGKSNRTYNTEKGRFRVYGSNGPIGWTDTALVNEPGVVLGRKGAYRGVQFSKTPFFVIDTAYYVKPKNSNDIKWLYYAIISDKLGEIDDGSPIPSTTRSAVYVREIEVPPIKLQKAIASILGSLDDKIELNRRTNETLEAMARALFRDWFVDFGPTRAKMAGEAPYLAPELWELFPDRLDDEGKPEGWHIASIDFLCRIKSGKRPPNKETSPSDENPIPVYGGNGISWFTKNILFDQPFLITGRVGTLGTVFRVNEKCWVSDNALCLFPKIDSYFEYLYFLISGIDFQILNSGSTQPLLTQSSLSSQECILPAEEIITIFHAQASVWFEKQQQLEKESRTLAQLRDLLLPKLMSGEISIRDAEKMVENAA